MVLLTLRVAVGPSTKSKDCVLVLGDDYVDDSINAAVAKHDAVTLASVKIFATADEKPPGSTLSLEHLGAPRSSTPRAGGRCRCARSVMTRRPRPCLSERRTSSMPARSRHANVTATASAISQISHPAHVTPACTAVAACNPCGEAMSERSRPLSGHPLPGVEQEGEEGPDRGQGARRAARVGDHRPVAAL